MAVWERIKALNPGQFYCLSKAFISKPFYIIPTYKATRETIEICNKLFGEKHHQNNPSNAFRHALWNYLICERCYKTAKSVEKAVSWSKKITGLHEKLFQNKVLSEAMDLHNNKVGRIFFEEHLHIKVHPVEELKKKMNQAVRVEKIEEIEAAGNRLVYLEKTES